MSAMAWNLIKLDAIKILYNLTERDVKQGEDGNYKVEFKYDFSDKNSIGRDIISSEDTFADNALFFQLRKILKADSKLEVDQSFMRSTLIFIDFKEVFSKYGKIWSSVEWPLNTPSKDNLLKEEALPYRMQLLFKDGLFLSFDGENFKNFVPFDKSSSMARNSQITFIDSQTKKALDKRLMLDMYFIGKPLVLSKFYAYRGLYLSTASRVESDLKFPLNEKTVIVLKDCKKILSKSTFGASQSNKLWIYETKESDLNINLFDGEGLISPDFAEYISNFLQSNCNYPNTSHSFQVRMPFTKGVLHEVDFNKFFAEYLPFEAEKWLIKDVFGITRDLRKAKIILTKSMFKFAEYMKEYLPDPMKYFFEKFANYDHALYVTNTEARLFNPGRVKLNHQFLSTLDLSDEDFKSLVADHLKLIDSLPEKFVDNASLFSDEQISTNETYESDEIILRSSVARTTCLKALAKNPAFIKDPKVKSIYEGIKKSYECDLGLGRLEVEGEQRFLSCDLLFLLIKILESVEGFKLDDAKKKSLYKECLYSDRFFMPESKLSIKPDKKYVFLRNPHLSRNEQVLLRAYVRRKSLHEKYFSHLKGIVMVSTNSTAAMALGGADFDGDLVKVISDKRIVQAVERGNIDKNLPPIEIPSTVSMPCPLTEKVPLRVIVDTFSNKVGLVSNWAVKLAKKEYSSEVVEENYFDAPHKETYLRFLALLEELINQQAGRDVTKVADDIFFTYDKNPIVIDELKDIVREENFKKGMTYYIAQYKPELKKIVGRLRLFDGEYLSRLNEKLSKDAAYLWKIDDVNRQIDNLFDELCLIEAINFVLSTPQKNLSGACRALGDKLNTIRIPRAIVEEFQPDLKSLLQTFSALSNNTEKNFVRAAKQINQSAQRFTNFFENQFEYFNKALTVHVDASIDSKLVEKLFNDAPIGIFFKTRDDFILLMKSRLQKFRQDEKTGKFFAMWREITGTASPAGWSIQNEIPILCAFQDCLDEAQSYFSALNKKSQLTNEVALDAAIKFICSDKLARLADKKSCERAFVNYFCGENYSVVITTEDLREILRQHLGNNVYSWFSNRKNCESQIRDFAEKNYQEKFLPTVREKVHELSAEEAQEYLEELIVRDTLLGIRVLKNS